MVKKMPVTPRAAQSTAKTDVVTPVSAEAVSRRAYSLFLARGREHGHDVEDWLLAETELTLRAFDSSDCDGPAKHKTYPTLND